MANKRTRKRSGKTVAALAHGEASRKNGSSVVARTSRHGGKINEQR